MREQYASSIDYWIAQNCVLYNTLSPRLMLPLPRLSRPSRLTKLGTMDPTTKPLPATRLEDRQHELVLTNSCLSAAPRIAARSVHHKELLSHSRGTMRTQPPHLPSLIRCLVDPLTYPEEAERGQTIAPKPTCNVGSLASIYRRP